MSFQTDETPVLVGFEGDLDGQRWLLSDRLVLGRDEACDVQINNRLVSRQHARLYIAPNGVILEDLGSKNGTHCNGEPVISAVLLSDGDVIQIAVAQKFIYLSADATLPLDFEAPPLVISENESRLQLDKRSRRVWIDGKEIIPPLSVSQFRLLDELYQQNGLVVPRDDLIASVWGEENAIGVTEQALDALVRRLRDRLATIDAKHTFIVTVRGHGLRLDNPKA